MRCFLLLGVVWLAACGRVGYEQVGLTADGGGGDGRADGAAGGDGGLVEPVSGLAGGALHTCAWKPDGSVECWGANDDGQLGVGDTRDRLRPTAVTGLSGDAQRLRLGHDFSCVRTAEQQVQCWGGNTSGQLGDGTTMMRSGPGDEPVSGLGAVQRIAVGWRHACAVGDELRCWGNNFYGQLGDGTDMDRATPVLTNIGVSVSDVGAGLFHTCALGGGELYCWGRNDDGQIGNGTTSERQALPVRIMSLPDPIEQVALGRTHTCALAGDGSVLCWGRNEWGQVGEEGTSLTASPVGVQGLPAVEQLRAGYFHTCALEGDGTLWCWGANSSGQIHTDADRKQQTPFEVPGSYADVWLGDFHTCALRDTGRAVCWGLNMRGQLGDGTTEDRGMPTPPDW
jgi:alpha-tubulin suppressor-like RCC1 family protein